MRIISYAFITLGIFVLILSIIGSVYLFNKSVGKADACSVAIQKQETDYVLECQRMAALATNPDWSYDSCLKEFGVHPEQEHNIKTL